ncbi:MAG: ethanolamine utilization protein EutJ [Verrucomicrobia bacterium]|nr:MAG: ethanolamine utilization protein EutJ [Verrucomicrobiota bacterium]
MITSLKRRGFFLKKLEFMCPLVGGVLFMVLGACKKAEDRSNLSHVIRIGMTLPLSGLEASYGQDSLHGAELATEELNARGGVLGRKIELVVKDNQSKAGETSIIVRDLISRSHVTALVGEGATGRSLEAAPIAQKNRIPFISSGSTNVKVTKIGDYIFRMCFIDTFQGAVMAKFAYSSLGKRNIAVISDNSKDYSIGLAQSFSKAFIAMGGRIVAQQIYSAGDKDFSSQLTAIKAAHPDAIFLPSYYTEATSIINQARELGFDVPFLGGDGWDSAEFLKMGGQAVEGVYFVDHFSADNKSPLVQNFVKSYARKYGTAPSALAALAYDSIKLLADAMQRIGETDPMKVRDALAATVDCPAVTGTISFDEDRNPKKAAVIVEVRNHKFNFLKTTEL